MAVIIFENKMQTVIVLDVILGVLTLENNAISFSVSPGIRCNPQKLLNLLQIPNSMVTFP